MDIDLGISLEEFHANSKALLEKLTQSAALMLKFKDLAVTWKRCRKRKLCCWINKKLFFQTNSAEKELSGP
jgi:hypothetical protein